MPEKILVVDDEEDFRIIVKDVLERAGYEAITASNGQEGLEYLQGQSVDLAILDWMMPIMDGLTLCQMLRQEPSLKTLPVILLTVKKSADDQLEGFHVGADDYVVKPF